MPQFFVNNVYDVFSIRQQGEKNLTKKACKCNTKGDERVKLKIFFNVSIKTYGEKSNLDIKSQTSFTITNWTISGTVSK